jgi:hypothetical protein
MKTFFKKMKSFFYVGAVIVSELVLVTAVYASATSNFTQIINGGTLAIDIVNASYVTVASPSFAMANATFSFACQSTDGNFGEAAQQIYVVNPDASDTGWVASLAASAVTAVWDSAGTDFDFNDPTTAGCADGGDTDSLAGQMTVDPSVGTLAIGACGTCTVTGITKGTSSAYNQGTVDSITILNAAAGSDDIGDWTLQGVDIDQTIPAQQPAAADYDINMVLSIIAQ